MGKNNSNPRKLINSKYNSIKYCEQNKCLINKVNALLRPIFLQKHAQPDSKWMQQQSMLYMKRIFLCVSKNGQSHKTLCIYTPMSFHLSVGMPMLHCLHTSLSEQAHDTMCIYITLWASPMIHFEYRCTHLSVDVPIVLTGHLGMGLVLGLEVEVLVAHIVWLSGHQALVLEHFDRSVVDQVILQGVPSPTHPYHQVTIL